MASGFRLSYLDLCTIMQPHQELAVILYPRSISSMELPSCTLTSWTLFVEVMKVYRKGAVRHTMLSITLIVGIRYKDILKSVEECSPVAR